MVCSPPAGCSFGNYLGCLKKGLEYQEQGHEVIFLIANYHSLTTIGEHPITEQELVRLGCKNIKRQTPEYTELFFKIACKMNTAKLQRMPQYKDKKDTVEYDLGLLLYPALMCADIIINDPDVIVIGRDQVAHVELCNDVAKRVGVDKEFKYELGDVEKVMSLQAPDMKMSKSLGEKHVLYLFDEDYSKKLRKANTNDEGLANLKTIAHALGVRTDFESNLALKDAIAARMSEIFK